jgi:hypothetical protein
MNGISLKNFFSRTILWLVPSLIVWYFVAHWLTIPLGWSAAHTMQSLFSWAQDGYQIQGTMISLLTSIQIPDPAGAQSGRIALASPEIDYRLYGFGLPLFVALMLAKRPPHFLRGLVIGVITIFFFQSVGMTFGWLKQIIFDIGAAGIAQTGFSHGQTQIVALGYQLSTLLLPTLIPITLWGIFNRSLLDPSAT